MLLYLLFCHVLLIPEFSCITTNVTKSEKPITVTPKSSKEKLSTASSTTKLALLSEGGSISDAVGLALPQENHKLPLTVNDSSKNKVVARKGVNYSEDGTKSQENSVSPSNENTTNKLSTSGEKPKTLIEHQKQIINDLNAAKENSDLGKKTNDSLSKPVTVAIHKKPLTLVAEELEHMTVKSTGAVLSKTETPKKPYLTSPNNPGMVMPIVITILLVPMFAVLGYMALRRGQEAWKNRHYKRMDFLLDGMYND